MATTTLISVEEYLRTSFPDGDREYVDGRLVERCMGEKKHARAQTLASAYLIQNYPHFCNAVELRVQVRRTRFRVPDVCLVAGPEPDEEILTQPPFLVIEVLSPDDRAGELQEKIEDYLAFGVKYVWVVNPYLKKGFIHTTDGIREARDGILRTENPLLELPLIELWRLPAGVPGAPP
jgi:Uma2 family endonuclease